jgi:NSS family neurotransmitter:Na+ symporter
MLELPSRVLVDAGVKRNRALTIIGIIVFILGIPSARSLNFLSNQDFVWGVALMISGALIAMMIIKQGANEVLKEINLQDNDVRLGGWWVYNIRWFIPSAALILLIWWLAQTFVPGEWYNPFRQFSFMSCIFQWSIVLVLLIVFNKRIAKFFI